MTTDKDRNAADAMLGYFRFTQAAIGVLLALLVLEVARSLTASVSAASFVAETVLLVVLVFILVELYVVLSDLHIRLELPYAQPWLYMDVLIGVVFIWYATSIGESAACKLSSTSACTPDLRPAMRIGIVMFVAFWIRMAIGYYLAKIHTGLEKKEKRALLIRSIADLGGVTLCLAVLLAEPDGFLGLTTLGWSLVGAGVMITYFIARALPYQLRSPLARRNVSSSIL